MNWRYKTTPEKKFVEVCAEGTVSGVELLAGALSVAQDPAMGPDVRVLMDFSDAEDWCVNADEMITLATGRQYHLGARRAVVVKPGWGEGLFGFYKSFAQPETVAVFGDRLQALEWLNEGAAEEEALA